MAFGPGHRLALILRSIIERYGHLVERRIIWKIWINGFVHDHFDSTHQASSILPAEKRISQLREADMSG